MSSRRNIYWSVGRGSARIHHAASAYGASVGGSSIGTGAWVLGTPVGEPVAPPSMVGAPAPPPFMLLGAYVVGAPMVGSSIGNGAGVLGLLGFPVGCAEGMAVGEPVGGEVGSGKRDLDAQKLLETSDAVRALL